MEKTRITLRIPNQVKELLEHAAVIKGFSNMTPFIIQAAIHEAYEVIDKEHVVRLSIEDSKRLCAALEAQAEEEDLKTAFERVERNEPTIPLEEVIKEHGLDEEEPIHQLTKKFVEDFEREITTKTRTCITGIELKETVNLTTRDVALLTVCKEVLRLKEIVQHFEDIAWGEAAKAVEQGE